MLGYPIRKEIREKLQSLKSILSRTSETSKKVYSPRDKESKKSYQENISQTPYIFMASSPIFEVDDVKRGEAPVGGIVIGNQDSFHSGGNTSTKFADNLYSARGVQRYMPSAGVTSLSSEFLSSDNVMFVRHITINWSCFTLNDLDILGRRFLTLGRKVYVEWGRASSTDDIRPTLINEDGTVNIESLPEETESGKKVKILSEATRLREKVIALGKGNFDAAVGWVNNFSWTSREDGGFDCTTEITVQGVNALDAPTNVSTTHNDDGKKKPTAKFIENSGNMGSEYSFKQALQDLPDTMIQILLEDKNLTGLNVYNNRTTATAFIPPQQNVPFEEGSYGWWSNKINKAYFQWKRDIDETMQKDWPFAYWLKEKVREGSLWNDHFEFIGGQELLDNLETMNNDPEYWDEKLQEGYNTPGYYENAKQEKQDIIVDEHRNVLMTIKSGIQDEKATWDNIKSKKAGNLQGYLEQAGKDWGDKNFWKLHNYMKGVNKYRDIDPEQCWVRWGWFEDNMLNKFFALLDEESKEKVSWIRSIVPTGEKVRRENRSDTASKEVDATTGGARQILDDYESIDVSSHPHFRTTDINKFIFPGKFDIDKGYVDSNGQVLSMKESNEKNLSDINNELNSLKERWITKGYKGDLNDKEEKFDSEPERALANQIKTLRNAVTSMEESIELAEELNSTTDLDSIREKLTKWPNSISMLSPDLDSINPEYEPYLHLKSLDTIVNLSLKPFSEFTSEKGKLRNIMINVKHLQDIFSNTNATLGENMNVLFESLARETGGLINLMMVADNRDNDGRLIAQERNVGKYDAERLEQFKNNPELMYEFPVMQNDSFVKSQELTSDISSENYKILLSKSYDERIQTEKKKGISLIHHAQIGNISGNEQTSEESKYKSISGVKPAFQIEGYKNYGQPQADEDIPLGPNGSVVTKPGVDIDSEKEQIKNDREQQLERDLERRDGVFSGTNIAYTADGKLKSFLDTNMREEIKWKKVEAETDEGIKYKVKLPNVDEYGMVGITNTLTMKGIAGIVPSNVFTTTYLPRLFREHSHFYATDVGQTIDSTGWHTTITGRMVWKYIADIPKLEGVYKNSLIPDTKLKLDIDYDKLGVLGAKMQQGNLLTPNIKINLNKTKQ